MIILTVKRNLTWSVPGKKSLKMNRRDSSATLQHWSWCISIKHEGATRAHPDNWKMKAKNFPRFTRTDHHYTPLCRCLLHPTPFILTSSAASEICDFSYSICYYNFFTELPLLSFCGQTPISTMLWPVTTSLCLLTSAIYTPRPTTVPWASMNLHKCTL